MIDGVATERSFELTGPVDGVLGLQPAPGFILSGGSEWLETGPALSPTTGRRPLGGCSLAEGAVGLGAADRRVGGASRGFGFALVALWALCHRLRRGR